VNRPIIVKNRITFSTVIGQFAYCLCLTTFLYVPWALQLFLPNYILCAHENFKQRFLLNYWHSQNLTVN